MCKEENTNVVYFLRPLGVGVGGVLATLPNFLNTYFTEKEQHWKTILHEIGHIWYSILIF